MRSWLRKLAQRRWTAHRKSAWLSLAPLALGYAHVLREWNQTPIETTILARFARHLADGQGWTWNPGELSSGFGSPIWALIVSQGIALGSEGIFFAKLLSLLSFLGLLYYLARRAHWVFALFVALTPAMAQLAASGTDSFLFVLLLCVAFCEGFYRRTPWSALAWGVLCWVRPESVFVTVPLFAIWVSSGCLTLLREPICTPPAHRRWFEGRGLATLLWAFAGPIAAWMIFAKLTCDGFFPPSLRGLVLWPGSTNYRDWLTEESLPAFRAFWKSNWLLAFSGAGTLAFTIVRRWKFGALAHLFAASGQALQLFFLQGSARNSPWYASALLVYAGLSLVLFPVGNELFAKHSARWKKSSPLRWSALLIPFILLFLQQRTSQAPASELISRELNEAVELGVAKILREGATPESSIFSGELSRIASESGLPAMDGAGVLEKTFRVPGTWQRKQGNIPLLLQHGPDWVVTRIDPVRNPGSPAVVGDESWSKFERQLAAQPEPLRIPWETWVSVHQAGLTQFDRDILVNIEFHEKYAPAIVTPLFGGTAYLAVFCRVDQCEEPVAQALRNWAPNLGVLKARFGMADAEAFLERTSDFFPGDGRSRLELARLKQDRRALRSIASTTAFSPHVRAEAFTALGLDEYQWKEFNAALSDFRSAVELDGSVSHQISNVGWALKALGQEKESESWFKRAESTKPKKP